MTMSNLQKRMHRRNVPPLLPSLRHSPVPVASSGRTSSVNRTERSAPSDTEPQDTLMPDITTLLVPNITTPSPSEEFWDLFNHEYRRADARNNTENATRDEGCYEFVMDGDAPWDGSYSSEEEVATDGSSQTSEVEDHQDNDMHEEGSGQNGVPIFAVPSAYLKLDNQLNEITRTHANNNSNPAEISSPPSRRLKLNPNISDAPKTIDAQLNEILWRPQDSNTTGWQTPFCDAETLYRPPRFSTPNPPSSPSLVVTGTSTKRTREGETINRGTSTPPTQDPEPRLLFLPQFDAFHISTWVDEDNDPDIARLHVASLREMRDRLVGQIAGPEEREKAAKRSEEYDAQCKEDKAQYDGQIVLCRLVVEKERLKDEIKRAKWTLRKRRSGFSDCGHMSGDKEQENDWDLMGR